jgi:hypothetical protein
MQHLSFHSIVEICLCPEDLVVDDLERIKHPEHPILANEVSCTFHHNDSTRLKGFHHPLNRNQGHAPAEDNQIESVLAKIVFTVAYC